MFRLRIWWQILRETTLQTLKDLWNYGSWGNPIVPILLYAIYVAVVWRYLGAAEATLELWHKIIWLSAPFWIFGPWWLVRFFRTVPEREKRLRDRADALELRLLPILKAKALNDGRPARWLMGAVNRTIIPRKHPDFAEEDFYLGLECHNPTATYLQNCTATLLALRAEGADEDLFTDPLPLEWLLVGDNPDHHAQFPSGGRRKLIVTKVAAGVPRLYGTRLPPTYQAIFDAGRVVVGRILLSPFLEGGTLIDFRIIQKPELTIEVVGGPLSIDTETWPNADAI